MVPVSDALDNLVMVVVPVNPMDLLAQADELTQVIERQLYPLGPAHEFFDRAIIVTFLALQLLQSRHPCPDRLYPLIRGGQKIMADVTACGS